MTSSTGKHHLLLKESVRTVRPFEVFPWIPVPSSSLLKLSYAPKYFYSSFAFKSIRALKHTFTQYIRTYTKGQQCARLLCTVGSPSHGSQGAVICSLSNLFISSSDAFQLKNTHWTLTTRYKLSGEGANDIFFVTDNGDLFVKKRLDRETKSTYRLTAQLLGGDNVFEQDEFTIEVQDINDHTPKFLDSPVGSVKEGSGKGREVFYFLGGTWSHSFRNCILSSCNVK